MKRLILPIGSTEQHGPHLPLDTDALIAQNISNELGQQLNTKVLPVIGVSLSAEHDDFPGTKKLSEESFQALLLDLITNYLELCDQLIILNAHGGNSRFLRKFLSSYSSVILIDLFKIIQGHLIPVRESQIGGICHAGEFETSLMMYLFPSLVKFSEITPEIVTIVPELDPNYEGQSLSSWKTSEFSKSGVIGDPTKATKEKGEAWLEIIIKQCMKHVTP